MKESKKLIDLTIRDIQARLPALLIFQTVAQHKNFARAAEDFMVTPTAISKTIKQLEEQLGVRLFNRNTRSTSITEAGQKLLTNLKPALEQIKLSLELISYEKEKPAGLLRINSSFVAYTTLIEPHLPSFLAQYPEIKFEICLDSNLVDIVKSNFDAGIRLGHAVQKDMFFTSLGKAQSMVAVASPEYLSKFGKPLYPEDLLKHNCIRQRLASYRKFFEWNFQINKKLVSVDIEGQLIVDEMRIAVSAAKNGIGIAYVFKEFIEVYLNSGELKIILEKFSPKRGMFYLYYPSNRQIPEKLRVFLNHIRKANY